MSVCPSVVEVEINTFDGLKDADILTLLSPKNLCSLNIGGYLGGISSVNILGRARYPMICYYSGRVTFVGGVTPILKTNGIY